MILHSFRLLDQSPKMISIDAQNRLLSIILAPTNNTFLKITPLSPIHQVWLANRRSINYSNSVQCIAEYLRKIHVIYHNNKRQCLQSTYHVEHIQWTWNLRYFVGIIRDQRLTSGGQSACFGTNSNIEESSLNLSFINKPSYKAEKTEPKNITQISKSTLFVINWLPLPIAYQVVQIHRCTWCQHKNCLYFNSRQNLSLNQI